MSSVSDEEMAQQNDTAPNTPGGDSDNDNDTNNNNNNNGEEDHDGDTSRADTLSNANMEDDTESKTPTAPDEGDDEEEDEDEKPKSVVVETPSSAVTSPAATPPKTKSTATTDAAMTTPTNADTSITIDVGSDNSKKNNNNNSKKRKGMPAGLGGSRKGRAPAVSGLTIPFRTVKKAMKLDPDIPIVQNEAAIMTTLASELFLKALAQESHGNAKARGRNTIRCVLVNILSGGIRRAMFSIWIESTESL